MANKTSVSTKKTKAKAAVPAKARTKAANASTTQRWVKDADNQSRTTPKAPKAIMHSKLALNPPVHKREPAKPLRWIHTPFVAKLALCSAFILVVSIVTMLGSAKPQLWWFPVVAGISLIVGAVICHD